MKKDLALVPRAAFRAFELAEAQRTAQAELKGIRDLVIAQSERALRMSSEHNVELPRPAQFHERRVAYREKYQSTQSH